MNSCLVNKHTVRDLKGIWNEMSKLKVNYNFVLNKTHRETCYILTSSQDGVLAAETTNHHCIYVADTLEEAYAIKDDANVNGASFNPEMTTWHTLTVDWRMAIYKGDIVLVKGGLDWMATGLMESPMPDAHMVPDPHTFVTYARVDNVNVTHEGDLIVARDPGEYLAIYPGDIAALTANPNSMEFICTPLISLMMTNTTVYYRDKTHIVADVVLRNTSVLFDMLKSGWLKGSDAVDAEESMIARMDEVKNED